MAGRDIDYDHATDSLGRGDWILRLLILGLVVGAVLVGLLMRWLG